MLDIKIVGGVVLDGTGAPPRPADVGVKGDRIVEIGDLAAAEAACTVLAATAHSKHRCMVTPGFIDVHSHSDVNLLLAPEAPSKIFQGVTTEVVGNCGASAAPVAGLSRLPSDWRRASEACGRRWRSMEEYRSALAETRPAVNVVPLVGHRALRAAVMGYENRDSTRAERAAMIRLLEEALDQGARGMSSGLIYPPGCFATRAELETLASVVARRGGVYASHIRSEKEGLLDALREIVDLGRATGARVQVSHLKTGGPEQWRKIDEVLNLLRRARADGVDAAADRYPYTASWTSLDVLLPSWVHAGGPAAAVARLRDRTVRERLRREVRLSKDRRTWESVVVASVDREELKECQGRTLAQIAQDRRREPVDVLLDILDRDAMRTQAFFFTMSEANMKRILAEPWVMVGSDASVRTLQGPLSREAPHPRAFGTFPRFLRMALDGEVVPLHEAVRKMTSLPAERFGLRDRGVLAVGRKADLVIFDPERVRDRATYADPRQLPEGIGCVIVNGVVTVEDGRMTGKRAGRVL